MPMSSTPSDEGGVGGRPSIGLKNAPIPLGRSPTITARSSAVMWPLWTGRILPVTVATSPFSWESQVPKQPSL